LVFVFGTNEKWNKCKYYIHLKAELNRN